MFHLDPKQAVLDHVLATPADSAGVDLPPLAASVAAKPVKPSYSAAVIVDSVQVVEAVLLAAVGFAVYLFNGGDPLLSVFATLGAIALTSYFSNLARAHRISEYRTFPGQVGRVLLAWAGAFAVLTAVALVFDRDAILSRGWLVYCGGISVVALVLFRYGLYRLVTRWTRQGKLKRRTVIVGGGSDAEVLIESIVEGGQGDFELLGLFDDRNDVRSPESVAHLAKLGRIADLIEFARRTRVDLVIVSMPLSAERRVLDMLKQLWVLPVDIRLSAHMSQLRFTPKAYSYVGNVPVFDMADRPISDWNLVFKWLFDKVVALVALILLSPVMLATAIAIKLDSKGPVFFRQKRHGFNNQLIDMWKFRSMRTDMLDANASKLVTKGDPRVTKVGRFIRKTSIDELPQLFNVLLGDLSIVGPRPHALQAKADNKLYYEAVDGYFARHRVKPGMTGWAQIKGWRGETDTVDKIMQRVNHDLYYIENWSLWLDLKIVLMTPLSLISERKNAF